ncbi:hypothetical protein [Mucilaginibacter ginsenosidivorax]|uniref:hypothetical protein n=1 Tax=Mucilaginibacter ginsenosidivorax TaxID=862126 RepID=UPI001CEF6C78|nr:hypothetical protein [Mucilaginibacter ginsenosidivorax]
MAQFLTSPFLLKPCQPFNVLPSKRFTHGPFLAAAFFTCGGTFTPTADVYTQTKAAAAITNPSFFNCCFITY